MKARVMIVDDEESIRKLLKGRFDREGYEVCVAANADEALNLFNTVGDIGVMVTDLKMPGKDGFTLIQAVKEKSPNTQAIVITGHGEKEAAIQSIRTGAANYFEKPFDLDQLTNAVKAAIRTYGAENENKEIVSRLEARVERVEGRTEDKFWFVSKSESMNKVNEWLSVLRREAMRGGGEEPSVVILGESGTGKEGIARMIHAGSRRGKGPWVAVNCANFSEQLLESELFGHEKGSFTGANSMKRGLFEIARGGTLFLDELGEMDQKLQARLLRVLQEKVFRRVGGTVDLETDVRVVAATNADLINKVQAGQFREDLYHRLCRVVVEVPPLRNRTEDVLPMAKEFCQRAFAARGKVFPGFTPEAEAAMTQYNWPGNVRELLNVIERTALIYQGTGAIGHKSLAIQAPAVSMTPVHIPAGKLELVKGPTDVNLSPTESYTDLKKKWSDAFEREYLTAVLGRHGGNVSAAAREARLDRSNFLRLLRRHRLTAQEFRKVAA